MSGELRLTDARKKELRLRHTVCFREHVEHDNIADICSSDVIRPVLIDGFVSAFNGKVADVDPEGFLRRAGISSRVKDLGFSDCDCNGDRPTSGLTRATAFSTRTAIGVSSDWSLFWSTCCSHSHCLDWCIGAENCLDMIGDSCR